MSRYECLQQVSSEQGTRRSEMLRQELDLLRQELECCATILSPLPPKRLSVETLPVSSSSTPEAPGRPGLVTHPALRELVSVGYPSVMASDQPQETSFYEETPLHQKEMMKACETGDVLKLQNLFDAVGSWRCDTATQRTVDTIYPSGPPATSEMLHTAVTHNQPEVLKFLLKTYPNACVSVDTLLGSAFANPDLPTLEALRSHDPSIVN